MIKFILLATLLFSSSYAVDLATVASSDADTYTIKANRTTIESKEDVEKTQKYINKIPNDKCKVYIEDDNIKKDVNGKEYRFILDNFNYKTGYTKYNVYRQNSFGDIDQDKPLDTICNYWLFVKT